MRELSAPDGGFCCGQDADSEGVEGRYYVFTPGELERVLGPKEGGVFCGWYGITRGGPFEGKSIPNLIGRPDVEHPPEEVLALRERVYAYRLERTALHRDDKVLTAWNGLMLAALARAGLVLDEDKYLKAAADCADFLTGRLTDGDGRLLARWREGHAAIPGKLDDYAFYAWGLLELYAATFRMEYLGEAARLAGLLLDFFFDGENGGFYPYPSDGEQLLTRKKESYDGALPSGNAVAALVLSRLARLTGELRWRTAADLQLRWLAGAAEDYPAGHSFALLTLLEELWPSAELVCAAGAVPEALRRFLREESRAGLTVLVKTPENAAALAALAPFTTDYPCPEAGTRYCLCRGGSCAQPVEDIEDLKRMLEKSSV